MCKCLELSQKRGNYFFNVTFLEIYKCEQIL